MTCLQAEIHKIPPGQCNIHIQQQEFHKPSETIDCYFGVPSKFGCYELHPLDTVPPTATGFHFYRGGSQQSLLEAFVNSDFPMQTKRLSVGTSSFRFGGGRDYRYLSQKLAHGYYPQLEVLNLGVDQLFANQSSCYGKLGDITSILKNSPNLKSLYLYGNFSLNHPIELSQLELLHVLINDYGTGINGGPPDLMTISCLFQSYFPNLRDLYVDLGIDVQHPPYSLPDEFLSRELTPKLENLELWGAFQPGTHKTLRQMELSHKTALKIMDGIEEAQAD